MTSQSNQSIQATEAYAESGSGDFLLYHFFIIAHTTFVKPN